MRNPGLRRTLLLASIFAALPAHAVRSAFVASYGDDAHTSTNCAQASPCRSFAKAFTVVDTGGEIVALDGAGFGALTVDRSVSIIGSPGFQVGISVATGVGVTITAPDVVLRNLVINNQGGTYGVDVQATGSFTMENCVVSGFASGAGLQVRAPANVRIVGSTFRESQIGIVLSWGARADIESSRMLGNTNAGLWVLGTNSSTTTASVSDSVISGGSHGIFGLGGNLTNTGTAKIAIARSVIANNGGTGIAAQTGSTLGSAVVTVSDSTVWGNAIGLSRDASAGGTATIETMGNNNIRRNGTDFAGGPATSVPLQ